MPDPTPETTLIHLRWPDKDGAPSACGSTSRFKSGNPGEVTCFQCRRSQVFLQDQGVGAPTPLPQREMPVLLKDIIAESPQLTALADTATGFTLAAQKNGRGMFTIEEVIHHGDYRSVRRVEVWEINHTTVDAVLQSSAYCYGSWLHAEAPHTKGRRALFDQLLDDLRHGRENRHIGWSTFRVV